MNNNLDQLQQLSLKFLPRLDSSLIKGILLALILFADEESGREFKKVFEKFENNKDDEIEL